MTGHDRHCGDRLAALADGRLPEPARSTALDHLGRCATCRADYDSQLAMKGLLGALDQPGAPADLQARLAGFARTGTPVDRPPAGPKASRSRPRPTPARRRRSPSRRAARAGAGLLSATVLTLAGAYALGAGPQGAVVTPPVDRYVREHAAVTGGLPLTEPILWQLPAGATAETPTATTATTAATTARAHPSGAGPTLSHLATAAHGANRGAP